MSNTESMQPLRAARRRPQSRAALPPAVEQTLLFGMFAAGAAFWMAVIWWIVR